MCDFIIHVTEIYGIYKYSKRWHFYKSFHKIRIIANYMYFQVESKNGEKQNIFLTFDAILFTERKNIDSNQQTYMPPMEM